jgi:hypothetical protein
MMRKVAIVHNAYGKPSGEEAAIGNLAVLLEARGLEVLRFSGEFPEVIEDLALEEKIP